MPRCIRCGNRFFAEGDRTSRICPECEDFENERGFIICRGCGNIFEPEEIINGLCEECRLLSDEEDSCEKNEYGDYVSYESMVEEDLDDDFND